jgi:TATA-binding protein-associated factor Taf7
MYLLTLSAILFVSILIFTSLVLVPEGKGYRIKRTAVLKQNLELRQLEVFQENVEVKLQKLTSDNRHIIEAFSNKFDKKRFIKQFKSYFTSLELAEKKELDAKEGFKVYDVSTTSSIDSPTSFYKFLEAVNKSDWIIKINFPITFIRGEKFIKSSFTMRVYYQK